MSNAAIARHPFDSLDPKRMVSLRSAISPFLAMDVLAEATRLEQGGADIVRMELGEPGAPTPRLVREAAVAALLTDRIGYTPALGLAALRQRIASHYAQTQGIAIDAERVVVTTGSSGGFILTFLALFDPGDRVAITAPGYPAYRNILDALGLEPVLIPVGPAERWAMTGAMIEAAHAQTPLAGVLIMSPANPTGVVMGPDQIADVAGACRRIGAKLVSDEIYHGLIWPDAPQAQTALHNAPQAQTALNDAPQAQTALHAAPDAVIVNSFSKYFCMTGWRIGWLIVPEILVRPMERLAQSLFISAPYLSQVAAIAAFDATEELETVKAGYAASRALMLDALPRIGLSDVPPIDGAFYAYVDVGRLTNDSVAFCGRMLREAGVAATPGVDFDRDRGARTVRFSFAGSGSRIAEGMTRLENWLRRGV